MGHKHPVFSGAKMGKKQLSLLFSRLLDMHDQRNSTLELHGNWDSCQLYLLLKCSQGISVFWAESRILDEGWGLKLSSLFSSSIFFVLVLQTEVEDRGRVEEENQCSLEGKVAETETHTENWDFLWRWGLWKSLYWDHLGLWAIADHCGKHGLWATQKLFSTFFFLSTSHMLFPSLHSR